MVGVVIVHQAVEVSLETRSAFAGTQVPGAGQNPTILVATAPDRRAGRWTGKATSFIGGWLILPALGLLVSPLVNAGWLFVDVTLLSGKLPEGLRSALLIETMLDTTFLVFQVYVAVAFFRRWCNAPALVVALLIARNVINVFVWLMAAAFGVGASASGGMVGPLVAAGIWIPYFLRSKRVRATFVVGRVAGPDTASRDADSPLREPACRVAAASYGVATQQGDAEWHVIHDGNESGPLSCSELADKAVAGGVRADDLVKVAGGRWVKAGSFGFLQRAFLKQQDRAKACPTVGDSGGSDAVVGWCMVGIFAAGGVFLLAVWAANPSPPVKAPLASSSVEVADAGRDARSSLALGREWLRKKEYDKAIQEYSKVIALDPTSKEAYCNRGIARDFVGDHNGAINDFDEAIRLDPKEAEFYVKRGSSYLLNKEDYTAAIRDFDEAIRLKPTWAEAHMSRGFAWWSRGEYAKAVRDYDEAIRLDPNDAGFYSFRGDAWRDMKNYAKAIRDYDEAIRLDSKKASFYSSRGFTRKAAGDRSGAAKDFRTARTLNGIPEVTLSQTSDGAGCFRGTVHNDTGKAIARLKLTIKTAMWERNYEANVSVENNATATFSVFVGDSGLELDTFKVVSTTTR